MHVAEDLSPQAAKAYRLADNKVGELATWDLGLLSEEQAGLDALAADLEGLSFSEEELGRLLPEDFEEGDCNPDDIPTAPEVPITRPGDLWQLGDHRLL